MPTDTSTVTTTETGRRIRGDSKMDRLTPEQQACVRYWLLEERLTYRYTADLIRQKLGINVGRSAVAIYYHRHLLPGHREDEVAAAAALSRLPVGDFDAVTVNHAKALAFSALTEPAPQLDTADRLLAIVHRVHKQQIAERRLALEERRTDLREQELAARPPRSRSRPSPTDAGGHSRSENSTLPAPTRTPRSSPPSPVSAPAPQPLEPRLPPAKALESVEPAEAPPQSLGLSTGTQTAAPRSGTAPEPSSSPRLSTPDALSPPCASVPPGSLPLSSLKSPPDSPLFPDSSGINPLSPPPPVSSPGNCNSQIATPLPPGEPPRPPAPAPIPPKPRIPYREVTRAE